MGQIVLLPAHPAHYGQGGLGELEELLGQGPDVLRRDGVVGLDDLVGGEGPPLEEGPPAQGAHAGLGGLQPHEDVGLGELPGPLQLLGGGAVVGEVPDRGADGLQGLGLGLPAQGSVDGEDPGLGVAGAVGVDGVAQAPLLPDLLPQPGGHAGAQHGGEELEGEAPGVPVGQAGKGQSQVVLLDGLLFQGDSGGVDRRGHRGQLPRRQGQEPGLELLHDELREAPGQGHHHVPGQIVAGHVVLEPRPRHLLQGGLPAQDGPGEGGALVDRRHEPLGAQVLGVVLVHADLLQDDPPFGLDVLLPELGAEDHVAEEVHGPVQVLVQAPGVKAGGLLGGVGVDLPADGVHLLGQLPGGAALGPLEDHMLDEVGGAVLVLALVPGAGAHPDAQGGGTDRRDVLQHDAGPVGEDVGDVVLFHG